MAEASRDQNRVTTALGVSSAGFSAPTTAAVNPITHAWLVEASLTPAGTQDTNLIQVGGVAIALGQTTMSASLPVTIASNQSALPISGTVTANQGTNPWVVSGTVQAVQSGAWNITNITGTITLPTGASTLVEQQTQTTALGTLLTTTAFQARINTLGQKTMVNSTPVVLASDQASIPVAATLSAETTKVIGTVNQGTSPWVVSLSSTTITGTVAVTQATGTNLHTVVDSGTITTVSTVTAVTTITNPVKTQPAPSANATLSNVAGSASSVTLLASNTSRLGAIIVNDSTAILYVKEGSVASATSYTYILFQYDTIEIPFGYNGIITGIWASATGSARVTENTA